MLFRSFRYVPYTIHFFTHHTCVTAPVPNLMICLRSSLCGNGASVYRGTPSTAWKGTSCPAHRSMCWSMYAIHPRFSGENYTISHLHASASLGERYCSPCKAALPQPPYNLPPHSSARRIPCTHLQASCFSHCSSRAAFIAAALMTIMLRPSAYSGR